MSASATLIRTDRFAVQWGEGDSEPPPGFDFSCALLGELKRQGVVTDIEVLEADYWEHTNWYFWVTHRQVRHWFRIECSLRECVPALWLVDITKSVGLWGTIMGRTKERTSIAEDFRQTIEQCLQRVADVPQVDWIESDVAIDQIYE